MASNQAAAATMIRKTLKAAFPTVTFSVRSRGFSGGDAVDVTWTDGPTAAQVDALISQHEYGHFDGMTDLYEYSNVRHDIPQAKYVSPHRHISPAAKVAMIEHCNRTRAGYALRYEVKTSPATRRFPAHTWVAIDRASDQHTGTNWQSNEVDRELHNLSMLCRDCGAHTLPGDVYCPQCGHHLTIRPVFAQEVA